ncbi:MAG TPA: DEAD/DEAH box helicase [Rickettsiales bacterium]|nr:DEAD/DEAH box helicase [Rickettsiales bacterium]
MTEFPGVIPALSAALAKRGYTSLTSVQQAVVAPELQNSDLLVSAQTGSGKTVAFGLALAPTLLGKEQSFGKVAAPLALVIAPTRELALQVTRELEWLYGASGGTVASCVGGMDMRAERQALSRNPHIVVGTPGRLKDHVERGSFDTSQLKAVVLDEADEMLDMGFREELQYILDTAPKERRTLMFSATVSKAISTMAREYQKDAKRISTREEEKQHADIEYQALSIAPSDRENAIINTLRYHDAKSAIIFCGTRVEVNHLTSRLTNRGFSVVALSGELSQSERSHALQALRDGRANVCVATDVASRGIDLPGLALVIHADIPKNRDILLHRSGRTGRAGSKGISVLIVPHNGRRRAEIVLQNAKVKAAWGKPPSIENILERDRERFLANPVFNEKIKDEEKPAIAELLARHRPEQIAAALLRLHNAQKPAPEELLDAAPAADSKKASREDFKDSVWISLSAGRDMSAEARWILPMLCGKGNITKRQIGAIKIHQNETHVELVADCVENFFKAIGEGGRIEKNIVVTQIQGTPGTPEQGKGGSHKVHKKHNDRKSPFKKHGDGGKPKHHFKKKHKERRT